MIRRERVQSLANRMAQIVFEDCWYKGKLAVKLKFVKNSPRRVLKQGFVRLVPDPNGFTIVIHVRHQYRKISVERFVGYLAHELGHARQILEGDLKQDPKTGWITWKDEEFYHRYDVSMRRWVICKRGSCQPLIWVPWEQELRNLDRLNARVMRLEMKAA